MICLLESPGVHLLDVGRFHRCRVPLLAYASPHLGEVCCCRGINELSCDVTNRLLCDGSVAINYAFSMPTAAADRYYLRRLGSRWGTSDDSPRSCRQPYLSRFSTKLTLLYSRSRNNGGHCSLKAVEEGVQDDGTSARNGRRREGASCLGAFQEASSSDGAEGTMDGALDRDLDAPEVDMAFHQGIRDMEAFRRQLKGVDDLGVPLPCPFLTCRAPLLACNGGRSSHQNACDAADDFYCNQVPGGTLLDDAFLVGTLEEGTCLGEEPVHPYDGPL